MFIIYLTLAILLLVIGLIALPTMIARSKERKLKGPEYHPTDQKVG